MNITWIGLQKLAVYTLATLVLGAFGILINYVLYKTCADLPAILRIIIHLGGSAFYILWVWHEWLMSGKENK